MTSVPDPWSAARRVLCVRLDSFGDVLMTEPAMRAIRQAGDGRHVTLLTSPAGAAAGELAHAVDDVVVYESPWMKATPPRADAAPDRAFADMLRGRRSWGAQRRRGLGAQAAPAPE